MILDDIDYSDKELVEFIGSRQYNRVKWAKDYKDRLKALREEKTGFLLPWSKTHKNIQFRLGEVSVWGGYNSHKKSMLSSYALMHMSKSAPVGIMSFELPVEKTIARMARQAAGCEPSLEFEESFSDSANICLYDQMDIVPTAKVLGVVYYMATGMGCKQIMIDSLMMCGIGRGPGRFEQESNFIDTLVAAAKALQIHIHLVAHVRKPDRGEAVVPGRYEVSGASEISNKVDNVFISWEDKTLRWIKEKIEFNKPLSDSEQQYYGDGTRPDHLLVCDKQRYGDWEGKVGLWFHKPSLQFHGDQSAQVVPFKVSA